MNDPIGDVEVVAHNGRPEGTPSYDVVHASIEVDGESFRVALTSNHAFTKLLLERLSGGVELAVDADHPMYRITFNGNAHVDVQDTAAMYASHLGDVIRGRDCSREACDDPASFFERVHGDIGFKGRTLTLTIPRQDIPRLVSGFYWRVWLSEAGESSQASFDDLAPNGGPYPHYADIFPKGYATFP